MSLFTSFDLYLFMVWKLVSFSVIFFFMPLFLMTKLGYCKKEFFYLISNFLSSLNNSNFSKGLDFFLPFIMIFIFILNVISIYPYIFATTSQMSLVLSLSLGFWMSLMIFIFLKSMSSQISHFIPEGSPIILSPFLFLIELVSSAIRPVTLAVRLVANITAGHVLIILLSSLVLNFYMVYPLLLILNLVELMVSLIQSYIFCTLISIYYSEM